MQDLKDMAQLRKVDSYPRRGYESMDIQIPPQPPKKALCPFFLYRMDIYDQIKLEHPNLRITEVTRIIGQLWKIVDPQLKERYEQQYELNRRTAVRQRLEYETKFGKQVKSRRSKKLKRALGQIRKQFDRDF